MRRFSYIVLMVLLGGMFSCNTAKQPVTVTNAEKKPLFKAISKFSFTLNTGAVIIPIRMDIAKNEAGEYYGIIKNAEEKIQTLPFRFKGDSIFIRTPFFNSEIQAVVSYDSYGKFIIGMNGKWRNYMKSGKYEIPFTGKEIPNEINPPNLAILDGAKYFPPQFNGRWEVTFSPGTKDEYKAVGIFKTDPKNDARTMGTFLTETGDYRYLEGNGNTIDSMNLSCFDGSHAFYFSYFPSGDTLKGMFYSGKHWKEPWVAVRNEKFELTNPDSLTFIKDGYSDLRFSFPNLDNEKIDFPSEKYEGKVTIIQLMGSWCPNCVDETKVLTDFYKEYNEKGLEVIALCFEPSDNFEVSKNDVLLHKNYFNAPYQFLIAGKANTKSAAQALPMLNHVMSFPTTIYIDKKGKVRKIYTGFYGPSTGVYYSRYIEQTEAFVEKLLAE